MSKVAELRVNTRENIRAAIDPTTIDEESREFDIVWSTGARAPMQGYVDDVGWIEYDEELVMEDGAWDLSRVENGTCPLLDSHGHMRAFMGGPDTDDQFGTVLKVTFAGGKGRARCRFSFDPAKEGKWIDVKKGVIRATSPKYKVRKYEEVTKPRDKRRTLRAVKAVLMEISLLPIGADAGARVRAADDGTEYTAELELVGEGKIMAKPKTDPKTPKTETPSVTDPARGANTDPAAGGTAVLEDGDGDGDEDDPPAGEPEQARVAAPARQPRKPAQQQPVDLERVRSDERARVAGIGDVARALRIDDKPGAELVQRLVNEGTSLEQARSELIYARAQRDQSSIGPSIARVGVEQREKVRAGIENALMHRCNVRATDGTSMPLSEEGRNFRGMSFLRLAEEALREAGANVRGLGPDEIAGMALGMPQLQERARAAGMHTTSDFANILSNVQNKVLRDAYSTSPSNWKLLSRRSSASDYKLQTRLQLGDAPQLLKINEHGEYTRGTIAESKETYAVEDYGRIFAITRKAMINDDLSALDRVPAMFGRQAAELEAAKAIGILLANPTMADGNQLVSAAHANNTTGAIDIAGLNAAMIKLMTQKGLDGVTLVGNTAAYLVVPAALATVAKQFTTQTTPNQGSQVNPFIGMFKTILVEPRLDVGVDGQTADAVKWWMTADPAQVDMLEHAYLAGQDGVYIEQQMGFEVDGLQTKVRHTFGIAVLDWRGFVRSTGV